MSPRNFARIFVRNTGTTPAKAVERIRVEAARRVLEETPASLSVVADRCGFRTEERMRRSFIATLGQRRGRIVSGLPAGWVGRYRRQVRIGIFTERRLRATQTKPALRVHCFRPGSVRHSDSLRRPQPRYRGVSPLGPYLHW
jgi:AraC-like DNA-binding protein